jgi:hypothetical protein
VGSVGGGMGGGKVAGRITKVSYSEKGGRENKSNEQACDNSGRCTASIEANGITNCIYCGKELHQRNGQWFTWDADLVTNDPRPQGVT